PAVQPTWLRIGARSRGNGTLGGSGCPTSGAAATPRAPAAMLRPRSRLSITHYLVHLHGNRTRHDLFLLGRIDVHSTRDVNVVLGRPCEPGRGHHEGPRGGVLRVHLHVNQAYIGGSHHFGVDGSRQGLPRVPGNPLPAKLDLVALRHSRAIEHSDFELRG